MTGGTQLVAAEPPLCSCAFWCLPHPSSATFRSVCAMSRIVDGFFPFPASGYIPGKRLFHRAVESCGILLV